MKSKVVQSISSVTAFLIEKGLSSSQNFPSDKDGVIYISNNNDHSIALKNISYEEIYKTLDSEKNYNIKLIDGALIQLMYYFEGENLKKYRLAFFPSPFLNSYDDDPTFYDHDNIYADIINPSINIVRTPIRFDYDPDNFTPIHHSKSHCTIGQYKGCRIPVSEPLTPIGFIEFIIKNFYNSVYQEMSSFFRENSDPMFSNCIAPEEKSFIHFSINR